MRKLLPSIAGLREGTPIVGGSSHGDPTVDPARILNTHANRKGTTMMPITITTCSDCHCPGFICDGGCGTTHTHPADARGRVLYHAPIDCPDDEGSECAPDHWSLRPWRYDRSHGWVTT